MGVNALEVKDLSVKLAAFVILRGVTFAVAHGSTVGLVWRNGAGKTTALKSIVGQAPVLGGEIRLDGRDLTAVAPHHRAGLGLGYLPEDRRLLASLAVEEDLPLPRRARG